MIATFAIELFLAVYVTMRYRMTSVTRLASLILFFLAVFQLAEYNVCEGSFGIDSLGWSRLGYVAITALPPLGIHLATKLLGRKEPVMVGMAYATGVLFALFFTFSGYGLTSSVCIGNYVIFSTAPLAVPLYALYYYGWLFVGTIYSWLGSQRPGVSSNIKAASRALSIGYLVFIIPTTFVNIVNPQTLAGIPSIMCGFAVLLALMLAGEVLPKFFRQPALSELSLGGKITNGHAKKKH
jgi:hypothetical protein